MFWYNDYLIQRTIDPPWEESLENGRGGWGHATRKGGRQEGVNPARALLRNLQGVLLYLLCYGWCV